MLVKGSVWDHGVWSEALCKLFAPECIISDFRLLSMVKKQRHVYSTIKTVNMPKVNLNELVGYSNTPRPDNMRLIAALFTILIQADLAAGTELHITGAHGRLELQSWL